MEFLYLEQKGEVRMREEEVGVLVFTETSQCRKNEK
jgi:hypothetical protein